MTQEIAGNQMLDPGVIQDPYPFYRELHRLAPVWKVPGTEIFAVSSHALLTEATGRVQDFSSNMKCLLFRAEDGLPARMQFDTGIQTLANADPPLHTLHRSTVFPNFVAKRMVLLEQEIVELATGYVDRAMEKGDVEFMTAIGNMIPISVISRLIGFRDSNLDMLLTAAFDSTEIVGATLSQQRLGEIMVRSQEIQAWIASQLEIAANQPGEDILTSIGMGVKNGTFSVHEGIIIMQILLGAGGESTTSLLGNAVRILAEQPELQQRLREQPALIPKFVEEALRLESPFRTMLRSVPKDTSLGGVSIPAGSTLVLFYSAGNRDATVFERPDEVLFDRQRPHLTFGRGIHFCVGAPLARLEARVVLSTLLKRTRNIELASNDPPSWVDSLQVRRHERLPIQLVA